MQYYYDLHLHSCLSPCGDMDMTPNNLVNMAKILGLDVIALTDHRGKHSVVQQSLAHNYISVCRNLCLCLTRQLHPSLRRIQIAVGQC